MRVRYIGIDNGTTNISICVRQYVGQLFDEQYIEYEKYIDFDGHKDIPVLVREENGQYSFGYHAIKGEGKLYNHLLEDIYGEDHTKKEEAINVFKELLRYIYQQYTIQESKGDFGKYDFMQIRISCVYEKDLLKKLYEEVGFKNIVFINQISALSNCIVYEKVGELMNHGYIDMYKLVTFMVLDIGGYSTKIGYYQYIEKGTPLNSYSYSYPDYYKTNEFSGQIIDKCLKENLLKDYEYYQYIVRRIQLDEFKEWKENEMAPSLNRNIPVKRFSRLNREFRKTKELERAPNFNITRCAFDHITDNYMLIRKIGESLKKVGLQGEDIDFVILSGKSSQWYFVKERLLNKNVIFSLTKIKEDENRIIMLDEPGLAVARGLTYDMGFYRNPSYKITESINRDIQTEENYELDYSLVLEVYKILSLKKVTDNELKIPESYHGFSITEICDYAIRGLYRVKKLVIPKSIERIGKYAFNSNEIEEIIIEEGVKRIEKEAFSESKKLKKIVLPSSLEYLGEGAFKGCKLLKSVIFKCKSLSIPAEAFKGNKNLTYVQLPKKVDSIGENAFKNCDIQNIQLRDNLKTISKYAFSGNMNLKSVVIPASCLNIEDYAFSGCSSLADIRFSPIGEKIMIGRNAFSFTPVKSIKLSYINMPYHTLDRGLIETIPVHYYDQFIYRNKNNHELELLKYMGDRKIVYLPKEHKGQNITSIASNAFYYSKIEKVVIPSQYKIIKEFAFNNCKQLKKVILNEGLEKIARNAFYECENLEKVDIPQSCQ